MISSKKDIKRDLTVHTCSGSITIKEIRIKIKDYYKEKPTRNIIWDFIETDISSISPDDIKQFAHDAKAIIHSREGGKTAIVSLEDISFGLSKMYQNFAEVERQNIFIEVFRSLLEAEAWIFGEGTVAPAEGGDRQEAER